VLVGDLMLDHYIFGSAERLSPEAPVPVLHYEREEYRLGGAGSVLADLAVLGADVRMVGILGADDAGRRVREKISRDYGADLSGIVEAPGRPTVTKLRLLGSAQHRLAQQMIRLDREDSGAIDETTSRQVLDQAAAGLETADILCIEDYNKGLLTPAVMQRLIEMAKAAGVAVIIDPAHVADYRKYAGATALKLNRTEAALATGLALRSEEDYRPVAERLLEKLGLEAAIVTLNEEGAYLATRQGERRRLTTRPRQVSDATGAGDMVLAMLCVARAAGASWTDAVALANIAGGLEVEKLGCVPITPREIIRDLVAEGPQRQAKQCSLDELLAELKRQRAMGRKIVFTNGCFDLIHLGHVEYFRFAKRQGDILVVAVNTDRSIKQLKGPKRPIIAEQDRLAVLEELESIDYLVTFDDDKPLRLLELIRPDVLVKGADYAKEEVVGWELVESFGGRVALAPLVHGRSTSSLIEKILEAYKDG